MRSKQSLALPSKAFRNWDVLKVRDGYGGGEVWRGSRIENIPSHAGLRPRISIRVWPITGSRSTESLALILPNVHRLGAKLWTPAGKGYGQYCAASNEFEAFGREVKAFGGTWQMRDHHFHSLDCLQTLTNICNGTNVILEDVTETIEIFALEDKRATRNAKRRTTPIFLFAKQTSYR